jgi:hypothetical protein
MYNRTFATCTLIFGAFGSVAKQGFGNENLLLFVINLRVWTET